MNPPWLVPANVWVDISIIPVSFKTKDDIAVGMPGIFNIPSHCCWASYLKHLWCMGMKYSTRPPLEGNGFPIIVFNLDKCWGAASRKTGR
jgi:hypothetical protein